MAKLPFLPGFRFHPTDVELLCFYLKAKICGKLIKPDVISELDIYKFSPWDLPGKSCLKSRDLEWYFYCPRDRKYVNGPRTNRATEIGYWKTTGKDKPVFNNSVLVGMKRTLVFHIGKAPKGDRTDWVMREYKLEDKNLDESRIAQDAFVLCRIFQKSGPGPKNGEQYGAPFREEEWNGDLMETSSELLTLDKNTPSVGGLVDPNSSVNEANLPLNPALSEAHQSVSASHASHTNNYDYIDKMLSELAAEGDHLNVIGNYVDLPPSKENNSSGDEIVNNPDGILLEESHPSGSDTYVDLEDITCPANADTLRVIDNYNFWGGLEDESALLQWFDESLVEGSFLELNDLQCPVDLDSFVIQRSDVSGVSLDPKASLNSSVNPKGSIGFPCALHSIDPVPSLNLSSRDCVREA